MTKLLPILRGAGGFAYVASPYSHSDDAVQVDRFEQAVKFVAWCAVQKIVVHSPIVHWHYVARWNEMRTDAETWARQNDTLVLCAARVILLTLPGWKHSIGVQRELEIAAEKRRPIFTAEPLVDRGYVVREGAG